MSSREASRIFDGQCLAVARCQKRASRDKLSRLISPCYVAMLFCFMLMLQLRAAMSSLQGEMQQDSSAAEAMVLKLIGASESPRIAIAANMGDLKAS